MNNRHRQIKEIANGFAIPSDFIPGVEIDSGHIDNAYLVESRSGDESKHQYIPQRIDEITANNPRDMGLKVIYQ